MKPCEICLFVVLTFLSVARPAGSQEWYPAGEIEQKADMISSDPLGNLYLARGSQLVKYGREGEILARYSNLRLGRISQVDASDPLRILLYYKDFNILVFLDNFLAELREPVALDNLGMEQAVAVCSSSRNGFWVLDGFRDKLLHFNHLLEKTSESPILPRWQLKTETPRLAEFRNSLYLSVEDGEIMVFDQYGTFRHRLRPKGLTDYQLRESGILFLREQSVVIYPYQEEAEETVWPCPEPYTAIRIEGDYLYGLGAERVDIFKIKRIP